MYGRKQIFQCLGVVIIISIINFYKSAIRRDKEIQRNNKLKVKQVPAITPIASSLPQEPSYDQTDENFISIQSNTILAKQSDCRTSLNSLSKCEPNSDNHQPFDYKNQLSTVPNNNNEDLNCIRSNNYVENAKGKKHIDDDNIDNSSGDDYKSTKIHATTTTTTANIASPTDGTIINRKTKVKSVTNKRISKSKINGSNIETTSVLTYLFVTILLFSLIKAALDVSKHYREKRLRRVMDDNELIRRCSLQEYSAIKQPLNVNKDKRKSVPKLTELMPQSSVDSGHNNPKIKEQSRRMSTNPQDYMNGSGITTEPGSPAKAGKLLAGRPAPLLRRCSVPVFGKSPSKMNARRRPSMDSVSEDDSSPDSKRRVRMINRH